MIRIKRKLKKFNKNNINSIKNGIFFTIFEEIFEFNLHFNHVDYYVNVAVRSSFNIYTKIFNNRS